MVTFYLDVEPLLKYSSAMLHLSPATRNLNENPVNLHCRLKTSNPIIILYMLQVKIIFRIFRINLGFWETEDPPLP